MIRWTGLAPWEFEFPFPGSLTSTFLTPSYALVKAFLARLGLPLATFHPLPRTISRNRRRWRSNPSGKCSQERLTRGTVTGTKCRAAHPSGCARCWRWLFGNKNTNLSLSRNSACNLHGVFDGHGGAFAALTEMCSGSEAGSCFRLIDLCITRQELGEQPVRSLRRARGRARCRSISLKPSTLNPEP